STLLPGAAIPDTLVATLAYGVEHSMPNEAATLIRWMRDSEGGGSRLAYIRERPGASGAALASSAFAQVGRPTLALDLERLRTEDDVATVAALSAREAALTGAGIVAGPAEDPIAPGPRARRASSETPARIELLAGRT